MKLTRIVFWPGGTYEKRTVTVLHNRFVDERLHKTVVMDAANPTSVDTVPLQFETWEEMLKGIVRPVLKQKPYPFLSGLTKRIPAFFTSSAGVPFPQQRVKGYRDYEGHLAKWRSVTGEAITSATTEIGRAEVDDSSNKIVTVLLIVIFLAGLTFTILVGRLAFS